MQAWAADLPFGWWIVDSGADWCIAGAFIYEHTTVIQRLPYIWVRGVEGASTQVDAIVRVVAGLEGVDWMAQEVLVCDNFTVALWSTEYMAHFGFSATFGALGEAAYVCTPWGARVPLLSRPYRMAATCRRPTTSDFGAGARLRADTPASSARVAAVGASGSLQRARGWLRSSARVG